jgi:transposase
VLDWHVERRKRATVAVARKLAVIMHSMLITGEPFREKTAAA